jgi:hypothetical protein
MSFYGYTGIPSTEDPKKHVTGTVIKWLVEEGSYVQADTTIAEVDINGQRNHVIICFEARIEKELTKEGSISERDASLLKWNADGENIPYGRSYFITKPK